MSVRPRRRLRVAVVFGGQSVEHEVSLVSAKAIMRALDPKRYEVGPDRHHEAGAVGSPREIFRAGRPTRRWVVWFRWAAAGSPPRVGARRRRTSGARGDRGADRRGVPGGAWQRGEDGSLQGLFRARGDPVRRGRRGRVGRRNGQALMKTIFVRRGCRSSTTG